MHLKKSTIEDIHVFFEHQLDPESNQMAGFTAKDPTDKNAYITKWTRLLSDPTIYLKTILVDDQIVGNISTWELEGEPQISYWIDRPYWGKGYASQALTLFLAAFEQRPIYGRVAFDNYGSQRVLEKAGFKQVGKELFFANARGVEIEELVYRID